MGDRSSRLLNAASAWLYGWLLWLYPGEFRRAYGPQMAQVLGDLCRDTSDKHGALGLAGLWGQILIDIARSAPAEHIAQWRKLMTGRKSIPFAAGIVLLAFPALFAALNILQYELGISLPWNPFEALYASLGNGTAGNLLDMAIFASPLLALGLFLLPTVSVRIKPGENQLASIVIHQSSRAALILMGACLLVLAVFAIYMTAENLPCLLGQQVTC